MSGARGQGQWDFPNLAPNAADLPYAVRQRRGGPAAAILFGDRIEVGGALGQRTMTRADLAGVTRTRSDGEGGTWFDLVSDRDDQADLRLPGWARENPVFAAWLAGAPEARPDRIARADRERLLAQPRFGGDSAALDRALDRARTIGWACVLGGLVVAGWLLVAPLDPAALTLAGMCLLAGTGLALLSEGLLAWWPASKARGTVAGAALPALAVCIRALMSVSLAQPLAFAWLGVVCAAGAAVLAWNRRRRAADRIAAAMGMACAGAVLGASAGAALDAGLDTAPASAWAALVQARHESDGESTSYFLTLAPSPVSGHDVAVGRDLYRRTAQGDFVCVTLHPGALRAPWYKVSACGAAGA